ncbi:hypothetical protein [Mycobacteroides abscessus]|uniref:Cell wall-associated hydrolase, invasion-associated protein n=1 Tax=Mycobacteroides abscessus subsp. massiliense TaxID=1962118 RepID=A0A1U2EUK0_9MYCO|nr:hypothetical protein [Mycobacteroides abscessus]SKM80894.1 cell wall-associated hydrolase, invasion-associated protein [Mycobacteroides abscessus subsp. massiliense]SKT63909.1 cell wall-associated hydrolase, invasion-associated protein [Mycobacteroides abscessus subsp. massiliense]SKT91592.1 cell wall-associated hydrolase, invasion-associated protein [Mycobacteroides abscessus subsp. massiliense]SKX37698.1 cell wall-associated hydrolase, invasion-associated protein [Mycobacteroides abscessus
MSTSPSEQPINEQAGADPTDPVEAVVDGGTKQRRLWDSIPKKAIAALAITVVLLAFALLVWMEHERAGIERQQPRPGQLEIPFAKPATISNIVITPCVPRVSAELVSSLTARQVANGKIIIAEGLRTRTHRSGIVAALAVSMRQTEMRNLANTAVPASMALPHDEVSRVRHELGIFGRPHPDGSVQTRMDPARAARSFFADMRFPSDGTQWTPEDLADRMTPARDAQPIGVSVEHCRSSAFVVFTGEFYERYVDEVANEMAAGQYPDDNGDAMPPMASTRTGRRP